MSTMAPLDRQMDGAPARVQALSEDPRSESLVRRFSRQTSRVRVIDKRPLTGLDMNDAAGQSVISPERLASQLERLYMSCLVDCFAFRDQIVRLRSWRERPRTLAFLAVYALAWHLDLVAPALTAFLIILILHPPARVLFFPPIPSQAPINSEAGGMRKPEPASDSVTGAPERQPGEAVEQEARNFATNMGQLGALSGRAQDDDCEDDPDNIFSPSKVFEDVLNAHERIEIRKPSEDRHGTKEPVSRAVEGFGVFATRMLPEFIDTWERLSNAWRPAPLFPLRRSRAMLASCLLSILIILCLTTWDAIMKVLGFLIGLGFFGAPLIRPCLGLIDTVFPEWRNFLELRNTLLRGVPTNAQLTIALLRTGERNDVCLCPPPDKARSSSSANRRHGQDLDHTVSFKDEERADLGPHSHHHKRQNRPRPESKPQGPRCLANTIRRCTKVGVRVLLKVDKAKAWAGNNHAKDRLGALEAPAKASFAGPLQFSARYRGEKGHAYITKTGPKLAVSWRRDKKGSSAAWTVALADIAELRKVGGLGWKYKFMVEAVLGWQVLDGLVVKTREGREFHLTAIGGRDEIFNHLISMGSQMWEMF